MPKFFQVLLFLIVVYNILAFLIGQLEFEETTSYTYSQTDPACKEYANEVDTLQLRQHQRSWISRSGSKYCLSYESYNAINAVEADKRDGLINRIEDYENFWGEVYEELIDQSEGVIEFLADSLVTVASEDMLDDMQLAALVVSFVQDIPYSYVLQEDCGERETQGKPCLGNTPLGIVSPYEFIHALYGDCDTRAVLLYVLLENMDYDPMIVVSDEYAHAMLALNLPAQGDYIRHAGKKYYFWETTATGWGIGMLPPDSNNKNYWKKALVSN
ncbi:MAG: hypothetical protein GY816_09105 [Cytophagales bacterium]|nr:hypothetical protein [Cytophagales bacterium]